MNLSRTKYHKTMASAKFLITGSTSGLGASVLATLYKSVGDPAEIIATSSRAEAAAKLQQDYPGTQFRVVDYDNEPALEKAFEGVDRLFFVSTPVVDTNRRAKQHSNVIEAAKKAGVGHVYYSSLSFGGYGSHSKAVVQTAHLITEEQLKKSGISYTSIREGIYAEAFPVFAAWYPGTTTMYIPTDGRIAWTSRSELGEANARLMLRDPATLPSLLKNDYDNNVALLTGPRAYTFAHLAEALTRATGRKVTLQKIPREQYAAVVAVEDAKEGHGGKSAQFFELWASLLDAVGQGEAEMVAPLMGELLGRPPRDGLEYIEELVREAGPQGGYTWHQNYDIGKR
ncbi:NmrA-like family protein [Histoplasma capsulatum var. duboisii H88]|uniref:NmrA-like family protein n=5 Tax=Ajellomyces capsulatus TaxID=5037 RepID=A0A8A1LLF7_AJEC8|nr:NmrA-like family protein [Histoplasma capsulatum var. duboisii H88]